MTIIPLQMDCLFEEKKMNLKRKVRRKPENTKKSLEVQKPNDLQHRSLQQRQKRKPRLCHSKGKTGEVGEGAGENILDSK